ncbi:MAG: PH domain-containing protein [Methanomassiliicoccaceae archaeon]|nr:PH domain-containing protein [Methanomassiliicoccaceae archaeon]MCL2145727.1 PH domain-containing protein [Methanomassiliicoccaceae archaeon]
MEKIYKPNIGWIFWAHLILIILIVAIFAIWTLVVGSTGGLLIPILAVFLLIVLVSLLVVAKTVYTLDDERILIRGALKTYDIPYGSVKKIISTNKGLISEGMFVLSTDRICIFYGEEGKVSISPIDKPDALSVLRSNCPGAEYEEDLKVKAEKEQKAEEQTFQMEQATEGPPEEKEYVYNRYRLQQ